MHINITVRSISLICPCALYGLTVKRGVRRQESEVFELQSKVMEPFRGEKYWALKTVHLQRKVLETVTARKGKTRI